MMLLRWCTLLGLFVVVCWTSGETTEASAKTEDPNVGFLHGKECAPEILDLTIPTNYTSSLELMLVMPEPNSKRTYHHRYERFPAAEVTPLLNSTHFLPARPTVLYCPGFLERKETVEALSLLRQYQHTHNVLMIDTNSIYGSIYFRSVRIARQLGKRLGAAIVDLVRAGLPLQSLTLLGFSLGTRTLGHAANRVHRVLKQPIALLVALDPAGFCYGERDVFNTRGVAFALVLHTNTAEIGARPPLGHVDFYINGGTRQPATFFGNCKAMCSHLRSVEIWRAMLQYPRAFPGVQCSSVKEAEQGTCTGKRTLLSANPDKTLRGIFLANTTGEYPYYLESGGRKT